nr:retrovirus-related Pol polyprotein from transposon TNT 1-94 [Tanacetum cinerariifolium]
CRGKENEVNILKSIDEGPFQMGTVREPLAEGTEGAPHLGPERPRHKGETIHDNYGWFAKLINDMRNIKITMSKKQLNSKFVNNMLPEWGRFVTAVKLNRGLRDSNYDQLYAYLKQHETHAKENKIMLDRFSQHTVDPLALISNVSHKQHYLPSSSTSPSTYVPPHLADNAHLNSSLYPTDNLIENLTNTLALLTQSYKTFLPQTTNQLRTSSNTRNQATVQDGSVVVQNVQGQQNRGQGINPWGEGAAGYGGVQNRVGNDLALNVDNVFHADDCDAFDYDFDEALMVQTMFIANLSSADPVTDEVGPSYDSDILSEYVKDNAVPVLHRNVSSVLNDAYMMIYNDMFEPHAQSVYNTPQNTVVENLLTAELATYKEQVELYERRAKFELTEREQKINEHLRLVISDRNFKEETLKKKLHSIKLQLASTINHNKSMVEEVTFLKKDFKQKENKYLEDFLDMKSLKEKVDDRLFKLDQSLQTVHVLCRPKPYYNELNKGIQKALTKEIKEMKDVFEELEAEVAQNVIDRKRDEIERENLLITNDNLIAKCLTKEVFSVATNSELNVARFTKMRVAHTIVEARCLKLKAELSNLRDKSHNDNTDELVNRFPILRNNREAHLDYLRHLKESVKTIRDIVEEAKVVRPLDRSIVSACRYTKHSQEILEYTIGTYPQESHQRDKKLAHAPLITKKQVTFAEPSDTSNSNTHKHVAKVNTQKTNVPAPPSTGVNRCTNASGSQPRSNTKKNRISSAKGVNKLQVEEQPRTNKSYLRTSNRVDSSSRLKRTLMNFIKKFIGTVRFGNDHFGAIMGYGDYVIRDSVISGVYYMEGLGNNLFFVGKFCDSDLEVAFRKHSYYVRDTDGVELIKGSRGSNLYTVSVEDMMKSSPICLLSKASKNKSWLWHRCLNHLNFGTINDLARKDLVRGLPRLKFEKDHLCFACQLGKSKKHTHKPKTKITNLAVLNTLHMDLCGPMRVQTINGKKYSLVIIDDYSRFTWVKFLRSKDETPEVVIKFLQQIQVGLNKTVRYIRTNNGTKFVNQTLTDYYEHIIIFNQKTVPRTLQ